MSTEGLERGIRDGGIGGGGGALEAEGVKRLFIVLSLT
jgi:hypothetical protein